MDKFYWLKSILREKLPWISRAIVEDGRSTPDEFLDCWVSWLIQSRFVKVFGNAKGYIIVRPVRMSWVFDTDIDYFDTIWWNDPEGEVAWIDSLWAPGLYPEVLKVLKWTGKPYVAWSHKDKLYFKVIRELSGQIPSRREIAEAVVRELVSPHQVLSSTSTVPLP